MKIAVNTRLLLKNRLEGIGWFMYETLKRITVDHPEHDFIFIFDRPFSGEFIFADNITPVVLGPPARHPVLFYIWFEYRLPSVFRKFDADLFLSPDGYLSLRSDIPQIAVIHDISFWHRPKDLPWLIEKYYNNFFPKFANKATRIATVSEYSKKDISQSFDVEEAKIDVVYNGIKDGFKSASDEERKTIRQNYTGGAPYFLYVGALHPRKNITGLLKAFDQFKTESNRSEKLMIVGGEMHKTSGIFTTVESLSYKGDIIFTGRVDEPELKRLYSAALAMVYVPFFEGFGIPIAEAMFAGVPVICSDTTSMPEVGGDAVLYVNPYNTGQISEALKKLAENDQLRSQLIMRGHSQVRKFGWEKTSGLLWSCIEQAMGLQT